MDGRIRKLQNNNFQKPFESSVVIFDHMNMPLKKSAKVYLLILILLTSHFGAFAQRPPTYGPNPPEPTNLVPIIAGSGILLGAATYFYVKHRGPKIAIQDHLPMYLLNRNILPTPDAINLMHELNPRLSKKKIMRANKKLVNPEFPEIPQSLITASANAVQATTSMPAGLKEQVDGFTSRLDAFRGTEITIQPDDQKATIQSAHSILKEIEKDITSPDRDKEESNTVTNQLITDLLKVLNQTLDKTIANKTLGEEDLVLIKEISENLSELLFPNINYEQNLEKSSQLHIRNPNEVENIFFASAEPDAVVYVRSNYQAEAQKDVFNAAAITNEQDNNNMLKGFAIAVFKSNAAGEPITKGPEVEGKYFVKYTSPALKNFPDTYRNLSPPLATYASAFFPPAKFYFIIEDLNGKQMDLREPIIDFKDAFTKPQQEKVNEMIVVPIYVKTND
ncbi:MAG: hypothetical protein WD426_04135 [Anditalea sp.]